MGVLLSRHLAKDQEESYIRVNYNLQGPNYTHNSYKSDSCVPSSLHNKKKGRKIGSFELHNWTSN